MTDRWGRGRGRGWYSLRAATLRRDPVCKLGYDGCTGLSTIADHIVNEARGGLSVLANLQGVCGHCHDVKTRTEATAGRWPASKYRPRETHPGR